MSNILGYIFVVEGQWGWGALCPCLFWFLKSKMFKPGMPERFALEGKN